MGLFRWLAVHGLSEADREIGDQIYAALHDVETGEIPDAFGSLFEDDPDRCRRIARDLMKRDPFLAGRIETWPAARDCFLLD